jgi:hypothetical protein
MYVIQFKEDTHKENLSLLHNIKKDIMKLCENFEKVSEEAYGDRRYVIDQYDRRDDMEMDERRGGSRGGRSRMTNRGYNNRSGMGNRMLYHDEYPEYPFEEGGSRYDY